jgi:hypothetical protein
VTETTQSPPSRHTGAARTAALVAAGVLVGGGLVFALVHRSGTSGGTGNASAALGSFAGGPPSGIAGGADGGVAGEQHIQGTLAAKTATTVTVRSSSGTASYVVNATTEIVRNGQSATLGSVKVGDPVLVHVYPSSSGRILVERLFAGSLPSGGPGGYGGPPPTARTAIS